MDSADWQVLLWPAVLFGGLFVWLIIGSIVIENHNEVDSWERGFAWAGNESEVLTNFGSTHSSATASALADVSIGGEERTVAVVLVYPPPPSNLNLKNKQAVVDWVTFVVSATSTSKLHVFVDTGARDTPPYTAVTENVGIGWAITGIVLFSLACPVVATFPCWKSRFFD
ncbi:hypothetical protein LCGC14_2034300 [marine sediment metagenome]|uniref:Uncharacterized protein n=1 Tax=marine sediment metagenome TaxID=412755 RepID=A0A0F9FGB4_9ZZZZ